MKSEKEQNEKRQRISQVCDFSGDEIPSAGRRGSMTILVKLKKTVPPKKSGWGWGWYYYFRRFDTFTGSIRGGRIKNTREHCCRREQMPKSNDCRGRPAVGGRGVEGRGLIIIFRRDIPFRGFERGEWGNGVTGSVIGMLLLRLPFPNRRRDYNQNYINTRTLSSDFVVVTELTIK